MGCVEPKFHNCYARLKAPLPPGTRKKAVNYVKNLEYLKRKGNKVDDPIQIDLPALGKFVKHYEPML